ncbi:endopeptidase La [Acidaminobacter sp. JC074]|uniref:endopeptidase La n=1 Tax=Acidaminobacter sp. JC074 TaxID=2530199 RepID=UPI001F0DAF41|nr:endopeptidase La [Acidaminobacter sp. JC074]MCH4890393.1 endopeptidase La [Acidaminobacter sp. JC074]
MENNLREIAVIPLRGLTIFPYMVIHFDVGREKSIKALEEAMIQNQKIFLTTQKSIETDDPTIDEIHEIGTLCKVKQMLKLPGDTIRVLVEGISRAKIKDVLQEEPYLKVMIEEYPDTDFEIDKECEALKRSVLQTFEQYVDLNPKITPDVLLTVRAIDNCGRLADVIASNISLKMDQKQVLIEAITPKLRLEVLYQYILTEIDIIQVEKKINDKVKSQINKMQKEYYLKEQIKAIREELGEDYSKDEEVEELKAKIKKLKAPKSVKEKLEAEVKRLQLMAPNSAESNVIRTYVNNILDLPWGKMTKDSLDLSKSRKILDEDHYGLKEVKERVLEYLAVKQLTKSMKGPIICLVGPPGVGKTSIAKSIARSLNRKFIRMSLGGVRDEAEIRGHRRTYIGAIPGRIMNAIKEAGYKNPVLLFDEIDKLSSDFRGDPASALLEVLDPEQNKEFTDHYLEVAFDLSKVMFVTTANSLSTIPRPLLDRMEVIQVSGYTEREKLEIAKRYLVSKQRDVHGLVDEQFDLHDDAIRKIITNYTRESGVRELERKIAKLMRKLAVEIVENKTEFIDVVPEEVKTFLDEPIYQYDEIEDKSQVGVVMGLAWTAVGGTTLNIEVAKLSGKGKLVLTGQLGDVMKESARAGMSYIRSISNKYNLESDFHEKMDIHIHIPEGATPKDGPSAGITMATAVLSAITDIPVRNDVAMTGEITLRGRVLPIGGLKEKTLAAERAGIKKVLFPHENIKDLKDIPESVRENVEMVPVKTMDEVLEHALVKEA